MTPGHWRTFAVRVQWMFLRTNKMLREWGTATLNTTFFFFLIKGLKVDKGMMVHGNPSWQLLHKNKPSRRLFSNIDLIVCLLTGTYIIGFNGQSKVGRLSVSILSSTRHLAYLIKMLQSDGHEEPMTESSAVQELERGKNPKKMEPKYILVERKLRHVPSILCFEVKFQK